MALDPRVYALRGRIDPNLNLPDPVPAYVLAEIVREVADFLNNIAELTPQAAETAPASPLEGMIRLAVPPWTPLGGTVPRFVGYKGGSWVAID